jgi:hypothetical protein
MILQKLKFELSFWFKNLFKYKHGYAKNCLGEKSKKCPVCSTPWPIIKKTPTEKYLESINYHTKYIKVIRNDGILEMPKGVTGEEMKKIAQILKPEYDILTKGKGQDEAKRIGALQGYDERNDK